MKKVFISIPFTGRKDEDILKSIDKMHKIAEEKFEQKLEPVHNFFIVGDENEIIAPEDCKNASIYFLSEAIKKMSFVDYFIGVQSGTSFGCDIENSISLNKGIYSYILKDDEIKYVVPDFFTCRRK